MKLAIIGSRNLDIDIRDYIPREVSEIVFGGAKGIDTLARQFAEQNGLTFIEFSPEYNLYGKRAPLVRNEKIADYADEAIALWDGNSKGTAHTIKLFKEKRKKITVYIIK